MLDWVKLEYWLQYLKYIHWLWYRNLVISSDHPDKAGNARFTTVPLKAESDQV